MRLPRGLIPVATFLELVSEKALNEPTNWSSHLSSLSGVIIDLMHLMKPGGFNVSSFFCDIVSPPEDESELGLQLEPCNKLEDLQKRVRAKEQKKRAMAR